MITEEEVFEAYRQAYPQQVEKALTPFHTSNIADRMNKLGFGFSELMQGLQRYQNESDRSSFCPMWKELCKYLPSKTHFDADKAAWDWIIERITMDGWRQAIRQFFSDNAGSGHDWDKSQKCRQLLITAGIQADSMAYGPDNVFPAKIVDFWVILHGESNPAKAYEFLGNKRLADIYKAMPVERQRTYFNFTREERFTGAVVPDMVKRFMASMRQRTEQVKQF